MLCVGFDFSCGQPLSPTRRGPTASSLRLTSPLISLTLLILLAPVESCVCNDAFALCNTYRGVCEEWWTRAGAPSGQCGGRGFLDTSCKSSSPILKKSGPMFWIGELLFFGLNYLLIPLLLLMMMMMKNIIIPLLPWIMLLFLLRDDDAPLFAASLSTMLFLLFFQRGA